MSIGSSAQATGVEQMVGRTRQVKQRSPGLRTLAASLLLLSCLLTSSYAAISIYIATQVVKYAPHPLEGTPAVLGLSYRNVSFPARVDHLQIPGWLIPGVLPDGRLTVQRTIIVLHGSVGNRTEKSVGLLDLSGDLARKGFAVLAIDLRGHGEAPAAPLSYGYFEQRDVLGALDYLRTGTLPYAQLGHPRHIGGLGISMGASVLMLAAPQEPALEAIVSDCGYADVIPLLEREIPKQGHLPQLFTPGALLAARALYGIDFYAVRPIDVVASIAPRPIFFIHGSADTNVPPSDMAQLAAAARMAPNAHVQTWLVPGVQHAQSFLTQGQLYVNRVSNYFTQALGADTSEA